MLPPSRIFSSSLGPPEAASSSASLDLREEYANAFRTESYNEFWARVLELNTAGDASAATTPTSTAAFRLPSYRLFAEHLLDPDQPTIAKILALNRPENHSLLSDYFSETTDASLLCGLLLKDIEQTRLLYRPLKTTLRSPHLSSPKRPSSDQLAAFSNSFNPFCASASSPCRFQAVQASCAGLLKRLESRREKAQTQLRLLTGLKRGLSVAVIALTASVAVVAVVAAAHALVVFVAMPTVLPASLRVGRVAKASAQLDAAAKGTYILSRDLETISRVVARVKEEVEHVRRMVRFWLEREEEEWLQMREEVVRELRKNESTFVGQLDELEEHLYLCVMTINRARNLVVKEISKLD